MTIKEQFSRVFNRPEESVGALGKEQKGEYYKGIEIWGRKIKGGNNRD